MLGTYQHAGGGMGVEVVQIVGVAGEEGDRDGGVVVVAAQ